MHLIQDISKKTWIYNYSDPKTRYSLGKRGSRPFVCFGVNPSIATPERLDPTVASVARFARDHGYDGWLMLNLYPQRATNPDKMHKKFQPILHQENLYWIRHYLHEFSQQSQVHVWCAWGTLIEKRPYLLRCLSDIHEGINSFNLDFYTRGSRSKKGHPHHPLYLRKDAPLDPFNFSNYLKNAFNR
ncbi:MAG: hypothetical protein CL672_00845 [Balneola sp.]|nr:hypothetical protein [Balneola sp.]